MILKKFKQIVPNIFYCKNIENFEMNKNIFKIHNEENNMQYIVINDIVDVDNTLASNLVNIHKLDMYDIYHGNIIEKMISSIKTKTNLVFVENTGEKTFQIIGYFLMKYLHMNYFETIYWLNNILSLNRDDFDLYFQLFNLYQNL